MKTYKSEEGLREEIRKLVQKSNRKVGWYSPLDLDQEEVFVDFVELEGSRVYFKDILAPTEEEWELYLMTPFGYDKTETLDSWLKELYCE